MPVARTLWNRRIRVHDGVALAADVMLPSGQGPFPALVIRTPYVRSRNLSNPRSWIRLVEYGYALVVVDARGRNDSEGSWVPWVKDSLDARDTIEWVAAQAWCTGKIGMVGGSYEGLTQWWTAVGRPRNLACIAPLAVGGVRNRLPFFGTGIPSQYRLWWATLVFGKTQQFPGAPAWEAWMHHTPLKNLDETFGLTRSVWRKHVTGEIDFAAECGTLAPEDYSEIDIPVFIGAGWWDDQSTMRAWQAVQRAKSAKDCRLLIGGWDHAGNVAPRPVVGGMDLSASVMDTIGYIEQFLALHLKGERREIAERPRCRVFLTGEDRWDELDQWPHPNAKEMPLFLVSGGDARGLGGDGRLVKRQGDLCGESDTFVYDPNHPGRDMSNLSVFVWADPPLDHRYLHRRKDTLVYTSEPLSEALVVSGQYRLVVFVSSDRPDTDLFVSLSDVHPDGRAIGLAPTNVLSACLRLRYRNGPEPQLLQPGKVYEVSIDGSWVHHVFKPKHCLRITINSGNFPLMTRNAGTGKHWAEDEVLYPQTNTIHHSATYPSRVLLPVVSGVAR